MSFYLFSVISVCENNIITETKRGLVAEHTSHYVKDIFKCNEANLKQSDVLETKFLTSFLTAIS